jgi:hypothetical protein
VDLPDFRAIAFVKPYARNFWSRRSRRGKTLIVVGVLVLLIAISSAVAGDPADDSNEAATTTGQVTTTEVTTPPKTSPPSTARTARSGSFGRG